MAGWQPRTLAAAPGERTYTTSVDFDSGVFLNLNHNVAADQLQLNDIPTPFDFVTVALPSRQSVVRISTNAVQPQVVGEYFSAPLGNSRTPFQPTVDRYGNVWVANRAEAGVVNDEAKGSLTRIGLLIGGTRDGDLVAPPFTYNTCIDRDGDGLIRTSSGLTNRLAWNNTDGVDTAGGVSSALDECVIEYRRVSAPQVRTLAVDANNDLWVGGSSAHIHERLDGVTGAPHEGTRFDVDAGGFGGIVDRAGNLWSTGDLLRLDPSQPFVTPTNPALFGSSRGNAALAVDPLTGHVWHSSVGGPLFELNGDGTVLQSYALSGPNPASGQGLVVDPRGHVWLGDTANDRVWHLAPDPAQPGTHYVVGSIPGVIDPAGLSIDANGKIWVVEPGKISRINPDPAFQIPGPKGDRLGVLEGAMSLPAGPIPFNQSDTTGFVAIGVTTRAGMWNVVHDGGDFGIAWGTVTWTASEPAASRIVVEVRAGDAQAALAAQPFVEVVNGMKVNDVRGRYIEIRTTFLQSAGTSPVLYDLTVRPNQQPVATCADVMTANDPGFCSAATVPTIDAGSFDPDGEPLTTHLTPAPPFDVGQVAVTLTVTDSSNASASCQSRVTVVDADRPAISCPTIPALECVAGGVLFEPPAATAADNCSVGSVSRPPAQRFAFGTTELSYSAIDASGNASSCRAAVEVQDTQPPAILAVNPGVTMLWPPNHRMVDVDVAIAASDACDATAVSCSITSVTSNEPVNADGDANAEPDWEIVDQDTVRLRAERSGSGTGRVYTVGVSCTDRAGHTTTGSTAITVPHSKRGR